MALYEPGDKVRIDGIVWTLKSWPADDEGPFTATYENSSGGEVFSTMWANQIDVQLDGKGNAVTIQDGGAGEPAMTSAQVELVEKGDGVASTLGDIHDALAEVNAEIEATLDSTDPVVPAEGEESDAG